MNLSNRTSTILFLVGAIFLGYQLIRGGTGRVYTRTVEKPVPSAQPIKSVVPVSYGERNQPGVSFSLIRTAGVWLAAFLTLAAYSFLFGDNPLYRLMESIFVGVSAAYAMVIAFWGQIVPNLFAKLAPTLIKTTFIPGLVIPDSKQAHTELILALVVLALSIMLLARLSPIGGWIARWPLAFIVGLTAGLKLVGYIEADFLEQIRATILPVAVWKEGRFDLWASLKNIAIISGVLLSLSYFFFSVEQRGPLKYAARSGIWFLMITFGASFAQTVMGRISLLIGRLEFLFDDWLWLVDPLGRRIVGQ